MYNPLGKAFFSVNEHFLFYYFFQPEAWFSYANYLIIFFCFDRCYRYKEKNNRQGGYFSTFVQRCA
jgi:hypothetical protein